MLIKKNSIEPNAANAPPSTFLSTAHMLHAHHCDEHHRAVVKCKEEGLPSSSCASNIQWYLLPVLGPELPREMSKSPKLTCTYLLPSESLMTPSPSLTTLYA